MATQSNSKDRVVKLKSSLLEVPGIDLLDYPNAEQVSLGSDRNKGKKKQSRFRRPTVHVHYLNSSIKLNSNQNQPQILDAVANNEFLARFKKHFTSAKADEGERRYLTSQNDRNFQKNWHSNNKHENNRSNDTNNQSRVNSVRGQRETQMDRVKSILKPRNDLSEHISEAKGKPPFFEYPAIVYSPREDDRIEKKKMHVSFSTLDDSGQRSLTPTKWKTICDMIVNKYTQHLPINEMLDQNNLKEKVFAKIEQRLSQGKKLKRYDIYLYEELSKKELQKLRQEEISKLSRSSLMKNSKKYRQFQIQQKLEIIQKQAEKKQQQLQFQSDQQNSVIRSFMQQKQHPQKDHKMEIIKQAVSKKEMSVENANEIILQHQKQKNHELMETVRCSTENFNTVINDLKTFIRLKDTQSQQKTLEKQILSLQNTRISSSKVRNLRHQSSQRQRVAKESELNENKVNVESIDNQQQQTRNQGFQVSSEVKSSMIKSYQSQVSRPQSAAVQQTYVYYSRVQSSPSQRQVSQGHQVQNIDLKNYQLQDSSNQNSRKLSNEKQVQSYDKQEAHNNNNNKPIRQQKRKFKVSKLLSSAENSRNFTRYTSLENTAIESKNKQKSNFNSQASGINFYQNSSYNYQQTKHSESKVLSGFNNLKRKKYHYRDWKSHLYGSYNQNGTTNDTVVQIRYSIQNQRGKSSSSIDIQNNKKKQRIRIRSINQSCICTPTCMHSQDTINTKKHTIQPPSSSQEPTMPQNTTQPYSKAHHPQLIINQSSNQALSKVNLLEQNQVLSLEPQFSNMVRRNEDSSMNDRDAQTSSQRVGQIIDYQKVKQNQYKYQNQNQSLEILSSSKEHSSQQIRVQVDREDTFFNNVQQTIASMVQSYNNQKYEQRSQQNEKSHHRVRNYKKIKEY